MQNLKVQLENQRDYLKAQITEIKINIELCQKLGYSLQARKLTDEKDIYIEYKDYFDNLIKNNFINE